MVEILLLLRLLLYYYSRGRGVQLDLDTQLYEHRHPFSNKHRYVSNQLFFVTLFNLHFEIAIASLRFLTALFATHSDLYFRIILHLYNAHRIYDYHSVLSLCNLSTACWARPSKVEGASEEG